VPSRVLAALLGSSIVDQLFRCLNGSVAVSAYELSALPLPAAERLEELTGLVDAGANAAALDAACARLYAVRTDV
jgi:adenine-specific DNA-methyltransferase